jgi:4-hydroxybenzoate polyprenyltransferase
MAKNFLEFLIYSNILIGLCAAALTVQTYLLIQPSSVLWPLVVLVFSATVLVYSFHRASLKFETNKGPRYLWHTQNAKSYYLVVAVAGVLLLYSLLYIPLRLTFFLIPFGVITLAYTYPLFNFGGKRVPLKKLPYLKAILIAVTFSSVTVLAPCFSSGHLYPAGLPDIGLLFFERLLFVLAITLPFDVRDLSYDFKDGVKTIPALIGVRNTVWLSVFFLLCHSVLVSIHAFSGEVLSYMEWSALLLADVISAFVVLGVLRARSEGYYSGVIDGTMIVQSLLVLATKYLIFFSWLINLV